MPIITAKPRVPTYVVRRVSDRKPLPKALHRNRFFTLGQAMRAVYRNIEVYSSLAIFQLDADEPIDSTGTFVGELRVGHVLPRWNREPVRRYSRLRAA